MIFRVTLKDPDTLHDAIKAAVFEAVAEVGLEKDEMEAVRERRAENVSDFCAKWFEYGEYLTVELDTEAGTCVVMERGQ